MNADREGEIRAQLLANADLSENALDFMADPEMAEETKADIALWRDAAALIEAQRVRAEAAEYNFAISKNRPI